MKHTRIPILIFCGLLLAGCGGNATPSVLTATPTATQTPRPTASPTQTPTPRITATHGPTSTRLPTYTRAPDLGIFASPDGSWHVESAYQVANADHTIRQDIPFLNWDHEWGTEAQAHADFIHWTQDGRYLYYSDTGAFIDSCIPIFFNGMVFYRMDTTTGESERIYGDLTTDNGLDLPYLTLSPDDKYMIIVEDDIEVIRTADGTKRILELPGALGSPISIDFSPDGRHFIIELFHNRECYITSSAAALYDVEEGFVRTLAKDWPSAPEEFFSFGINSINWLDPDHVELTVLDGQVFTIDINDTGSALVPTPTPQP